MRLALAQLIHGCDELSAGGERSGQRQPPAEPDLERIVRVVSSAIEAQHGTSECLGFIYSGKWVVTAKHCVASGASVTVVTLTGREMPVVAQEPHPSVDVCMLRVQALGPFERAQIAPATESSFILGRLDREGGFSLRSGPGTPYRVLPDRVRIRSEVRPCRGDSGGPLLGGSGSIVGVLSRGSVTCDGRDEFVLLEPISQWLVELHDQ